MTKQTMRYSVTLGFLSGMAGTLHAEDSEATSIGWVCRTW
jgi:hypothetical protein